MRVSNAPTAVPNLLRAATRHAVVVGLTAAVFGAGLIASALPAYADVTTNSYTVGSPSGSVSSVVASPGSVGQRR